MSFEEVIEQHYNATRAEQPAPVQEYAKYQVNLKKGDLPVFLSMLDKILWMENPPSGDLFHGGVITYKNFAHGELNRDGTDKLHYMIDLPEANFQDYSGTAFLRIAREYLDSKRTPVEALVREYGGLKPQPGVLSTNRYAGGGNG
jgi:hypothetical protein